MFWLVCHKIRWRQPFLIQKMEQGATYMYQTLKVEDEEAVACLCVNGRTVFRQDRTDSAFNDLHKPAGMQLWALDMAELVKAGHPFTSHCLLVRELNHSPLN